MIGTKHQKIKKSPVKNPLRIGKKNNFVFCVAQNTRQKNKKKSVFRNDMNLMSKLKKIVYLPATKIWRIGVGWPFNNMILISVDSDLS